MHERQVERPFTHSLSRVLRPPPRTQTDGMHTLGLRARLLATHHCAAVEAGPAGGRMTLPLCLPGSSMPRTPGLLPGIKDEPSPGHSSCVSATRTRRSLTGRDRYTLCQEEIISKYFVNRTVLEVAENNKM